MDDIYKLINEKNDIIKNLILENVNKNNYENFSYKILDKITENKSTLEKIKIKQNFENLKLKDLLKILNLNSLKEVVFPEKFLVQNCYSKNLIDEDFEEFLGLNKIVNSSIKTLKNRIVLKVYWKKILTDNNFSAEKSINLGIIKLISVLQNYFKNYDCLNLKILNIFDLENPTIYFDKADHFIIYNELFQTFLLENNLNLNGLNQINDLNSSLDKNVNIYKNNFKSLFHKKLDSIKKIWKL